MDNNLKLFFLFGGRGVVVGVGGVVWKDMITLAIQKYKKKRKQTKLAVKIEETYSIKKWFLHSQKLFSHCFKDQ